jgi:hypothetical protein
MCLSVYLGTSRPLSFQSPEPGQLGVEAAAWTPPPLQARQFIYYLGRKGGEPVPLECSCLLAEHVDWTENGPLVAQDDTYSPGACAFAALRQLCDQATRDAGIATIVCDDSGGLEQVCSKDDYCEGLIRLDAIAPGNLLFAGASGNIPWRVLHGVR